MATSLVVEGWTGHARPHRRFWPDRARTPWALIACARSRTSRLEDRDPAHGTGDTHGIGDGARRARRGGGLVACGTGGLLMIPVMKPWLGEEEARAAADAVASGWVAQGPRVAEFEAAVRRARRRRARRRRLVVHDRAAPGDVPAGPGSRRRGRRALVLVHRHRELRRVRRGHARLRRRRRRRTATSASAPSSPCSRHGPAPSSSSIRAACRRTSIRSGGCAPTAASRSSRTPRAPPAPPTTGLRPAALPSSPRGRSTLASC